MGFVEITRGFDGYNAGRIAGNGKFGYVIYREPDKEELKRKLAEQGYKWDDKT